MMLAKWSIGFVLAALPLAALAEDYLGTLKLPRSVAQAPHLYSFASAPPSGVSPAAADPYRLKLGYRYSRYFAVEGEYVDFGRAQDPFASPGNLASAFRSTGFGVNTVATLPVWRFSFYGRLGAYRGDLHNGLGFYSTSLLGDNGNHATRLRYGLGMRYDITRALGIRAEVERYSPLGAPFAGESETDNLFSVGVMWRF
jgi:OOP family OmpA-OmpF porin